jgi:DHA1 family bicyclomycin/chloramphenicol resistance-like MFS transporter
MADRTVALRTLVILGALTAFGPLSMDLYLPALPALTRDLGVSASLGQLTMTSCMVGLAVGQLVAGPVSDAFGRRRPLLAGVACWAVMSVACAFAPDVGTLAGLRLVQGLAGGAGVVVARAVVRDLFDTAAAARVFSLLLLVMAMAPVLAPLLGGQLMHVTSWRGLFLALTLIGCALLAAAALGISETLPPARRVHGGARATAGQLVTVLRDRRAVGYAAVLGLGGGMLFTYISMGPFVMQNGHGLSPQGFSFVFAANALGLAAASRLNMLLVGRLGPGRMLSSGLVIAVASTWAMTLAASLRLPLAVLLALLGITVASVSMIMPNTTALAMEKHGARAGAVSGLLGLSQFGLGGLIGPLVSLGGVTTLTMATTMAATASAALVVRHAVARVPAGEAREADTAPPVLPAGGLGRSAS